MTEYNKLTDFELTHLLKNGDRSAFSEIHKRYVVILYSYAYKKIRNKEECQDLIQEVFVKLWDHKHSLQIQTNLAGYLYISVRNKAFDIFAHKKIELKYINSLQNYITNQEPQTDHLIRERQINELIEKEISALPPKMQEAFKLSRKNYLSHKQIAATLGLSEHTVTTQIKRALKVLRVKLGIISVIYILPTFFNIFK